MNSQANNETTGQDILNRFGSYGFIGGLALGLIAGVLISGPNFYTWPAKTSILVIFGSAAIGGLIGFFAPSYAAGSTASGASDTYYSDIGHGSGGDGSGSSGDGDSGGGDS
jgi:hypothetical protein